VCAARWDVASHGRSVSSWGSCDRSGLARPLWAQLWQADAASLELMLNPAGEASPGAVGAGGRGLVGAHDQ